MAPASTGLHENHMMNNIHNSYILVGSLVSVSAYSLVDGSVFANQCMSRFLASVGVLLVILTTAAPSILSKILS